MMSDDRFHIFACPDVSEPASGMLPYLSFEFLLWNLHVKVSKEFLFPYPADQALFTSQRSRHFDVLLDEVKETRERKRISMVRCVCNLVDHLGCTPFIYTSGASLEDKRIVALMVWRRMSALEVYFGCLLHPGVLSVDLNEPKDSSKTDKATKNVVIIACRTPKSLTLEIHHGGWFTPTPCRSYIGGQVSSVNVVDIDEFCLHDPKDMVVKLCYGVEDLMYCRFLIPSLGLNYGLHSLNVDADVLEMSKYVKDYKIMLVYVKHGSSIVDTSMFDSSPDVNRNPASSVVRPIIVESVVDPFDGLDEILGTSSTADDFLFGKFKEVEVEADTESKEKESDTKGNDTSCSDSEDFDYDPNHDDVFDDDEHIVEEVHVNMNNFSFTADPKHDTSIVRCEGTIPALVSYVAIDTNMDKNVFSQTKGGPTIRENINSGKQNILGKDKIVEEKGKRWEVRTLIKDHACIQSRAIKACTSRFLADHVIKSLATNPDIPVRAVQDQMQKQFKVGVSKMKAFRAKRFASNIITGSYREQYSLLREYAQELINQNPGTTVQIDVQQEPNLESLTRILEGCPWPCQILTAVGVDTNNGIYPVAYTIVKAESKASWCWFLNLLREDLGIEANFNYTFISDRQKGLIQAIASVFPTKATSEGELKRKLGEFKSFNSDAYDWLMKIPLEQWSRAYFFRAKCDLLINNICEVFNRQLVDGRDQPIITCLEYIREYLMKRTVVVQKVIAKTIGPLTPSVTKMFDVIKKRLLSTMKWELTGIPCKHAVASIYNMSENSVGVGIPEQWVYAAYRIETWDMYTHSRPPKKRKKSNDEIASQSASWKGKLVSCDKCGNVGHNKKGCRGQGGGSSQTGARKVCGQAAGSRKVSSQVAGARNVFGQASGARKASSQPSVAQSLVNQGPRQGFQGPIAGPASGSQRKTKKLVDL
ncbi:mutator type transposase [Tanacetum coccineum]